MSESYEEGMKAVKWARELQERQERSMQITIEIQKKYAKILKAEANKRRAEEANAQVNANKKK